MTEKAVMQFIDLPRKDVILTAIFPYLELSDLLSLRAVSKQTYSLVSEYVYTATYLDFTSIKILPKPVHKVTYLNCKFFKMLILFVADDNPKLLSSQICKI